MTYIYVTMSVREYKAVIVHYDAIHYANTLMYWTIVYKLLQPLVVKFPRRTEKNLLKRTEN